MCCFGSLVSAPVSVSVPVPVPVPDSSAFVPRSAVAPLRRNVARFSAMTFEEMDDALTLYPSHRCKTIHLVRHGQGYHNVAGEKDHAAYLSYEYLDSHLTPTGWQEVDSLRKHVWKCGIASSIELVVTSPLMRTMQTAVGTFGGGSYAGNDSSVPLMVDNAGGSNRPSITSSNCPPFIAFELCREQLGVHPCDKRKNINDYRPLFPAIDFSLLESDEDILWVSDVRENQEDVAARGKQFLKWLMTRKEKEIAVVSHSSFLIQTLGLFGKDCHQIVRKEIQSPFKNCEMRTFVIADRSASGSAVPSTYFPGGIPSGADFPSDFKDVEDAVV